MTDAPSCLVDTSAWIEGLRPGAKGPWVEDLRRMILDRQVGMHPVVRIELVSGALSRAERDRLAEMLDALPRLDMTEDVWREAADLGFQLRQRGVNVPVTDLLIAASAIAGRCILHHRDRHFTMIARHSPLKEKGIPGRA